MKLFINIIMQIVSIISYSATALFALFGIYELIMGPADAEKLLKKLHIPLTYNQTLIIGFIFVILAIAWYIIKAKLTGKL
ncbi:unknown [Eubacterium sp. CAG:841]|nr:unknown [Eubacterium sp. CAG:841]